jgi:hypothetical protein
MAMGIAQWMRVLETVGGLVQMSSRLRRPEAEAPAQPAADEPAGPLDQIEARLAGVVVAALKEAFDRDRARMDLERAQLDAERQRAEDALRAERRRQAAERALGQLRLIAIMAAAVWMLTAALGVWLPNLRQALPLTLMGTGWALAIGSLGSALVAWQQVSDWSADAQGSLSTSPSSQTSRAALWLLLASLALTGSALLTAL